MNEPIETMTDRLIKELAGFEKHSNEAHRLGRSAIYYIETHFKDLHLFEYYKELVYELAARDCFLFHSPTIRCGKCLPCKAVLITVPSELTPNEVRDLFKASGNDAPPADLS